MKFTSLQLRNFRNYREFALEIPAGVVVFHGPNGQGKTNLVEAFHFLMRGESFRPVTPDSLRFQSETETAANAQIAGRLLQNNLSYDIQMTFGQSKKSVLLNDRRVTSPELARRFPLVLFSPESLAAIKEGPDERRRLLDDVVMTHSSAGVKILRDFRHALRTRNRLLRDYRKGLTPEMQTKQLLESLEPSFLPLASELTVARLEALRALQSDFQQAARFVLTQADVDISVEDVISGHNAYDWSRSDLLSAMHNRSLELRERELAAGVSLVGPQRHDVRVLFTGKDSRFFCSQGQQRALILSFKMAQILYHYRAHQVHPVLLLDDVLSELDPIRRLNLVEFLKDIPAQIFLTTTDLSFAMDFGDRSINIFRVEKGTVTRG
jgi:DNA replication and repair protein RecF